MKKFYSFALIILSLFSCVFFSACGDKYKNLKIDVYSSEGVLVEHARFVIDDNNVGATETLDIKFKNIGEDVGQIVVYSIPNNLVSVLNYTYAENECFVEIALEMSSVENAKLVVSHLASGKKKQIPLTIDQKSTDVEIIQDGYSFRDKYIVSIPDTDTVKHNLDLTKTYELKPSGSTDKIFFKVDSLYTVRNDNTIVGFNGVKLIPLTDVKGLEKVYTGFEVSNTAAETLDKNSALKIYPVTFLADFNLEQEVEKQDQYQNKTISIFFKKTLNEGNVVITSIPEIDQNNIQLIANDDNLNSFELNLTYIYETEDGECQVPVFDNEGENNFFDMYEVEFLSEDKTKVSAFADSNNDIFVTAHSFTEQPIKITILLNPINFVGDIEPVELNIGVKGELKSDKIVVSKDGEDISTSEKINIFDYYETGTSNGALFKFNSGEGVHEDLNKMRIVVKPSILSEENNAGTLPEGVSVNSMLYSLVFKLVDDYLKFTYDEVLDAMVSEEIDSSTIVYIKYIDGNGNTEPIEFGAKVQTINKSTLEHWSTLENVEVNLNFNRLEGVKSMELQAGYYHVEGGNGVHTIYPGSKNIENVYLNRLEGLDNTNENVYTNFIYVADTVKGVDDVLIDNVEFVVSIESLNGAKNPLKLYQRELEKDYGENAIEGVSTLTYRYSKNLTNDVMGLVYRADTSLGEYIITFSQENIVRATLKCKIYENLTELKPEYVSLGTNDQAFKNETYSQYQADYIVAKGQTLDLSINLPQAVIDSEMVEGYTLSFKVGYKDGEEVVEAEVEPTEYFNLDDMRFNKGTYIGGMPQYVYVTIQVRTKTHETIVSEASWASPAPSIEISFFIYERIYEEDIKINQTSVVRYPEKFLALDYKNLSKLNLEINMDNELWDYTTGSVDVIWNIDGKNLEFNDDFDGDGIKDRYDDNGVVVTNGLGLRSCEFNFDTLAYVDDDIRIIKAYVRQFEKTFEFQCVVYIENPIVTERLVITSEMFVTDDETQTPYINLKVGETYQVLAENISSLGDVTNPEIVIQVTDAYGSAYNAKRYFDINQTTSEITVKNIEGINKFKLFVFAKDALREAVSSDKSGYNVPSNFLMEDYANAYFVMDIYLSDGSETNPYLIKDAYDFWEINENELFKTAHYQLMTSVSLDNVKDTEIIKTIDGFSGFISTYNNVIYSIDGIYLDKDMRNLFTNFSGEISNVKFSVNYAYNIDADEDQHLGLIDTNNGTLTNVGTYVRGYADLNGEATYYFGGLAGENKASIQYKDGHEDIDNDGEIDDDEIVWTGVVGVEGLIELSGNAQVYFGGLVGKNISSIVACENITTTGGENEIILNVASGRENTLSQLTINAEIAGESAIGGVVGLNSYGTNVGTIQNAFVQAIINAENTSNVGGVIGENQQEKTYITVNGTDNGVVVGNDILSTVNEVYKSKAIYNVKSASKIKALNNVGGIVGLDNNGLYLECDYQILTSSYKETAIIGNNAVGGIAGNSDSGKFFFCSVMSYGWNYAALNSDLSKVITDVADISAEDNVGGIVGYALSDSTGVNHDNNSISNKTIVVSSSVNAYLLSNDNIGGILSSAGGNAILFNVYFIGKLEGSIIYHEVEVGANKHYFALDNNESSYFNAAYSLNLETAGGVTNLKSGNILNDSNFPITSTTNIQSYWWWNANINGGYIFITKDENGTENSLPIFDLAPDSIDVQVVEPKAEGLERVLMLDYYDFSIAENATDAILLDLIERTNRNQYIYKIEGGNNVGLLNIVAQPSNLGAVVINVKSTNSNVVDITYDGRILINGVGQCELIFSSVLNPNAGDVENRTIQVVVDYPITDLHLSTSRTDKNGYIDNGSTQNIGQNSSKQYYAVTNGLYNYHETNYQYKTKSNLNFNVEINYGSSDDDFDIFEYLAITGNKDNNSTKTHYIVDIDEKTPFMISVLKRLESGTFNVKVTPYVLIDSVEVGVGEVIEFELSTLEGVTNVSFSYDDAIVYPNDIVYLNAYLSTDHKLERNDIFMLLDVISNNDEYNYRLSGNADKQDIIDNNLDIAYTIIKDNNITIGSFNLYIDASEEPVDNIQKIKLRIEFNDIYIEEELNFKLQFELGRDVYEYVNYTLLPQRINKIEIKNYYYRNAEDGELELVQQDILKPNSAGEMIIDIVPDNGYYDYLEISDITGNEEIVFIQVDEQGNALSLRYDPSSDGKGIKLYDYDLSKSRIYIRTQISNRYSSNMHTIEVRAYSSNDVLLASSRKYIDVKMLPEIEATYLLPDGRAGAVAGNAEDKVANITGIYLANGVDATFRIETRSANTEVETTITAEKWDSAQNKYVEDKDFANNYELIKISNNLYTLKSKVYNENNIGKKVKLTLKVYSLLDNGDYDVAQCSIEFTIASFVVHGVSVNSSVDNATTSEIYGYYNREIDLNFYFDEDDISFYDTSAHGEYFHDTVYMLSDDYDTSNKNLSQIYSILESLNSSSDDNSYLILNNAERQTLDSTKYEEVSSSNITLKNNKLSVAENYTPDHLAVVFMLNYDSGNMKWSIANYDGTKSDDGYYIVDKNYYLNFRNASKWFEPTVINSKTEFENMTSGEKYILNVDLTDENALTDYEPIDANIVEFDGNGHTIEIKSFAQFNDVSIKAGLFAQIYPNMIVKNVKVKYVSTPEDGNYTFGNVNKGDEGIEYFDICNNSAVAYTDAHFGGIAAVNNGIITNCFVEGIIAVNASTLENKTIATSGNYEINFNLGGVVAENSSTGYITNSSSQLNIFAQANIGGFVHTNNGKIVSCGVEENTTIYGYNDKLGNTIIVDIAGFAVDNSGEISMSYVNLIKKSNILVNVDEVSIHEGTMSAKDFSAGFVSNNKGVIYDAYVQISEIGVNNNRFAGFVDTNSGKITRAYTFINFGILASKDDAMFVGENSGSLNSCIQFVVENNKTQVEGLSSVDISLRNDKASYEQLGFAFGDNLSAVWTIQPGTLPKLVSTQEIRFEDFVKLSIYQVGDDVDDEVDEVKYTTDYANYGTKQNPFIIHNIDSWNYYFDSENNIYMTGYYRIVKDIDFTSVGNNPKTCGLTFSGNIQGNNMTLSGIMLYSTSSLSSLGLFEKLEGSTDKHIENSVRNLTLSATSVWASSTSAVGVLAGIIEDFNIYNITIDAKDLIIVGANAVGGVAGIIRGEFDMDQISSNVGANSTRASTLNNYSIYMSMNNGNEVSYNLNRVYYAGSVAGILDGYDRANYDVNDNPRNIDRNYYKVQNINVSGNVSLTGDTIGAAFGLVGEQVYVNRLNVNVSGLLFGAQYSAGAVGENRGVLKNATITLGDNIFKKSQYVSAGAVGFNLGGLVNQVTVTANIIKSEYSQTSGGVVGRNVNGVISNTHFDGEIVSYFAGGIVGANYNYKMIIDATTGTGAINGECKINSNLLPESQIEYYQNGIKIENFNNVSISINSFKKIIENSKSFYSYKNDETTNNSTLQSITVKSKVVGLVAGLSFDSSIVKKTENVFNLNYDIQNTKVIFNTSPLGVELRAKEENIVLKDESDDINDVKFTFENVNVLDIEVNQAYVIYLVGSVANTFDSWSNYSNEFVLVK